MRRKHHDQDTRRTTTVFLVAMALVCASGTGFAEDTVTSAKSTEQRVPASQVGEAYADRPVRYRSRRHWHDEYRERTRERQEAMQESMERWHSARRAWTNPWAEQRRQWAEARHEQMRDWAMAEQDRLWAHGVWGDPWGGPWGGPYAWGPYGGPWGRPWW